MNYYMIHIEKMDTEYKNNVETVIVNQYQLNEIKKILEETDKDSKK